jgi:hypothetical protein
MKRLWRDRRGVTALMVAGSASALLAGAALATDVGIWFVARRGMQNAADSAALAAASALAAGSNATAAQAIATDLVSRNGFAPGGVTILRVDTPPTTGSQVGNPAAVEVELRQTQPLRLARLMLREAPQVVARAVGMVRSDANPCVLALTGAMTLWGSTSTSASGCVLASNARTEDAVAVGGAAELTAYSLRSSGGCANCASAGQVTLERPPSTWQPPTPDPYRALAQKALPGGAVSASCTNSLEPYETTGKVYCGPLKTTGGNVLTVTPGTYYIRNGDVSLQGGGIVCPGCTGGQGVTFVLTGDPARIGSVTINGNATLQASAPRDPADPDWKGVLFYRDPRATGGTVRINGGSEMRIAGALLFPSSDVQYSGNSGTSNCTILVGGSITFTGNSDIRIATCEETGTLVPSASSVRLAE